MFTTLGQVCSEYSLGDVCWFHLQEFAWSERELPGRREERRSGLCGPAENCPMDTEPMFCFETSLKMLYWSMLVYRYEEV